MKYTKWVNKNIDRLDNKTVVITGATGSIGISTTMYLAHLNANIIIAVRNSKKGNILIEDVKRLYPEVNISMMIVDFSKTEKDFLVAATELERLGENIGVVIKTQREDIFDMMHRI